MPILSFSNSWNRRILLILLIIGLSCVLYFHWYTFLSFTALKQHHELLLQWTRAHYVVMVLAYMLIYIAVVALSVPGAVFMTLAGGLLFGPVATIYVVVSATVGAMILFLAVRSALGGALAIKAGSWLQKIEKVVGAIKENSFYYLLVLRFIPLFPFWVVNIVPALLGVRLKIFMSATFIGIIPGTFVYVMMGNGLNTLLATNQEPNLRIIFSPTILLPLIGLAILAIIPVIYKRFKKTKEKQRELL